MPNPEKTYAKVSAGISVLAIVLIFVPGWIGMDGMAGGYAVSFVSIFVAVSAALVAWLFWSRASTLDAIFAGKDLLAHWSYQPGEWEGYTRVELQQQTSRNKGLLAVMAAWAVLFGGLCWLLDPQAGGSVFLAMLGLILLLGIFALGLPRLRHWGQRGRPGDAWITQKAIYFDGVLVRFGGLEAHLDAVKWQDPQEHAPALLEFEVSYPTRAGFQAQTVRIPVPRGQDAEAHKILDRFS